jgi:hypothetical protein
LQPAEKVISIGGEKQSPDCPLAAALTGAILVMRVTSATNSQSLSEPTETRMRMPLEPPRWATCEKTAKSRNYRQQSKSSSRINNKKKKKINYRERKVVLIQTHLVLLPEVVLTPVP